MSGSEELSHIRDSIITIMFRLDERINHLECGEVEGSPALQANEIMELARMMNVEGTPSDIIYRSDTEYRVRHGLQVKG